MEDDFFISGITFCVKALRAVCSGQQIKRTKTLKLMHLYSFIALKCILYEKEQHLNQNVKGTILLNVRIFLPGTVGTLLNESLNEIIIRTGKKFVI